MNFDTTPEFNRELKALTKKWRSLSTDFQPVKKSLPLLYNLQDGESEDDLRLRRDNFFNNKRATILNSDISGKEVVKMRLDCASLGNKDMMRLVFIYVKSDNNVMFIELYVKNEKRREDSARIKKYLR